MNTAAWSTLVGVALGLAALVVVAIGAHERNEPPRHALTPVGERVPDLSLQDLTGATVSLRKQLGHRPAILFVVSLADCLSCANLPFEVRIVRQQAPRLLPVVIASGGTVEQFQSYFKQYKLATPVLVDEDRQLLRSVHLTMEPAVLIADSTGRILLADTRSMSQAAQFPIGSVLHALANVLPDS